MKHNLEVWMPTLEVLALTFSVTLLAGDGIVWRVALYITFTMTLIAAYVRLRLPHRTLRDVEVALAMSVVATAFLIEIGCSLANYGGDIVNCFVADVAGVAIGYSAMALGLRRRLRRRLMRRYRRRRRPNPASETNNTSNQLKPKE